MARLIKRGNVWYSDMRVDGKRINRALSKYKPEAQRILREMVEMRRAQKRGEIVRHMSWKMFREIYLKESRADKDIGTFYADRRAFELVDNVTNLTAIEQMTPERLARIRIALIEAVDNKKKPRYAKSAIVRGIRGIITAMRWAEDRKYISVQNWRIVQKKNIEAKGRVDFYERATYLELLPKLEGDWFTSALIMGRAGLRLGEMLHLEWTDIDFKNQRIIFRSKPHLGWQIKKDIKLEKVRAIPMLTADLRQHLEAIQRPSGFILSDKVSRREDVYGRQLSRALKATGIKTHNGKLGFPYILRHTFGSHLAQIGVSLTKIAAWMGHESERMTECYRHLCPSDTTSDINVVRKLYAEFVPPKLASVLPPLSDSNRISKVVLGALGPEIGNPICSSKLHGIHDDFL